ncbi:hypothetical protein HG264_01645 [Pseudomonas sp. gcc21]|uniref:hypothetical protein n=1 Tax=Pseudomonas sp. gcc21 TaxID=2726989 RepID=UPI001451BF91|nr:hypothetical protein [Pseudomonas sp. gcc21]QJD57701.1 hypothetical protein HG264_01645 [Pseudomonas sp. gcc21]
MKQRDWGILLLGKGLFASAALLVMLGAETSASTQQPQASTLSQQIVYSRPASATSEMPEQTTGPRWVF